MSNISFKDFWLNSSPDLKNLDITRKLFNCQFLSDVKFSVGRQIIYAHSLELMKRSCVFHMQFVTGGTKLIQITDCSYDSFLEFIRFIYTDKCAVNDANGLELLKLALKYKVIKLENLVINSLTSIKWSLQLFEYGVLHKYQIVRKNIDELAIWNFEMYTKDPNFLKLHPDALHELLKFDQARVTELQIFYALAAWIENYCRAREMNLSEGRKRFEKLIRKIRFPTMTNDEVHICVGRYPDLITDADCMSILKQVVCGSDDHRDVWISKPRVEYIYPYVIRTFECEENLEAVFQVTRDTILHGLRIGIENNKTPLEIEIYERNQKTNYIQIASFKQKIFIDYWHFLQISLGDSLGLKAGFEYTIRVKYLEVQGGSINVFCRVENKQIIINDPHDSVRIIKASGNIWEIIFKPIG